MPSYRVTMTVGMLKPGVAPDRVLPVAAEAARELTTVEAADLGIVAGAPRITIRFTADDAELARQLGAHIAAATAQAAEVLVWKVTERVKGRWYVVRAS
ncbi:hypothetical protein [Homoserinimonas sp. A520]